MNDDDDKSTISSSSQIEYLHRLIDQILILLKYYSIRLIDIDTSELNKLIEILYAYVRLITLLYDVHGESPTTTTMMIENNVDQENIENLIEDVNNYARTLSAMEKDLKTSSPVDLNSFQNSDTAIIDENVDHHDDKMDENLKILQSPIIKSRVANIFHLCPMLLNDPNINIRLNLLKLSFESMRLLRSYEDILLPYVHRFWDSLVRLLSLDLEHPIVVKNAFDCLMLANELCGDFLLRRISKEIIPALINFLQIHFDKRIDYYRKHCHNETLKTMNYFIELELLKSFGKLAVNIKLQSEDICKILPILLLYTCSKGIVNELQENSLQSLIIISNKADYYSVQYFKLFYGKQPESIRKNDNNQCSCQKQRNHFEKLIQKYSNLLLPLDHHFNYLNKLIIHLNYS
ncbi:TEL2-interacting protein 1 [Dermatophagoides pteronyssinus]|uniref:TEL2-interacting protein 1 n=1 Tax=Dermatophagoides pteronyssinus TaxID=6956 RepID=A0ABQ8JN06_DERPT|nr:TEL2-interacting protein 1 [Dermatophagoides pteronyssinus]